MTFDVEAARARWLKVKPLIGRRGDGVGLGVAIITSEFEESFNAACDEIERLKSRTANAMYESMLAEKNTEIERLRMEVIDWKLAKADSDREIEAQAKRIALLEDCDCVPAIVSSFGCRKCGRRNVITQERFMEIVRDYEAQAKRYSAQEAVAVMRLRKIEELERERDEAIREMNHLQDKWYAEHLHATNKQRALRKIEAEVARLREALREITATNWREIKDGVAYNQETPFQFEQRIHKIASDALHARAALEEEQE